MRRILVDAARAPLLSRGNVRGGHRSHARDANGAARVFLRR
ncbi:MAG: hypothetical protein ABW318_12200 [Vicinamibacterales bacterium]